MGKYIKSHSNYVYKKKHQNTSDGTIYERDITSIGGIDNFAKGQTPIYRSGNFLITTHNEDNIKKDIKSSSYVKNSSGDTWTLATLSSLTTDDSSSSDSLIELKKNIYDLTDFAYFGSCAELMKASIKDIIKRFPGELYAPTDIVSSFTYNIDVDVSYADSDGNPISQLSSVVETCNTSEEIPDSAYNIVSNAPYIEGVHVFYVDQSKYTPVAGIDVSDEDDVNITVLGGNDFFLIDNPFGIDLITKYKKRSEITDKNRLKFFCNGGYKYYNAVNELTKKLYSFNYTVLLTKYDENGNIISDTDDALKDNERYACFIGERVASITFVIHEATDITLTIYAYYGTAKSIVYLFDIKDISDKTCFPYRFRPKEKEYNSFIANLDLFEKTLMNQKSDPLYTSTFNIKSETDDGYSTEVRTFTLPKTYGDYNIGSTTSSYDTYLSDLSTIAEFYDENFSDNIYRSLTHKAIKTLDDSAKFDDATNEDISEGQELITKFLRIAGREFDELKAYSDNIINYNNITYDGINNLPNYFLTDALENDGWNLTNTIGYNLKETSNNIDVTGTLSIESEKSNKLGDYEIVRTFTQDNTSSVTPYSKYYDDVRDPNCPSVIFSEDNNGYFWGLRCDMPAIANHVSSLTESLTFDEAASENPLLVSSYTSTDLINTTSVLGAFTKDKDGNLLTGDTYTDCCGIIRRRIKNYSSENEYTYNDINTEFMKRLILNSKQIYRHKGTIEGVEMILGLFGMKSKQFYESLEANEIGTYDYQQYIPYDFEIKEYTSFAKRIEDTYISELDDFKYNWANDAKNISYISTLPYKGLPVTYRTSSDGLIRYLYPDFQSSTDYDGSPYYQMNGGWQSMYPFMFNSENALIINAKDDTVYSETIRDIQTVKKLGDLFTIPSNTLFDNEVFYVSDISESYAIVDGIPYELLSESDGDNDYKYFLVYPSDSALQIGEAYFTDYVIVSNPYTDDKKKRYGLENGENDGNPLKVYLIAKDGFDGLTIDAYSDDISVSTITVFEDGKYMDGNNFTHYFKINDTSSSNQLSVVGWEQLSTDSDLYTQILNKNDNFLGNNPHTGHASYDNGHEYFTYFSSLFKYALDNDSFIDEILAGYPSLDYDELNSFGFSGLISSNLCNYDYNQFLTEDKKVHYFGDFYGVSGNSNDMLSFVYNDEHIDNGFSKTNNIVNYNLLNVNPLKDYIYNESESNRYGSITNVCSSTDAKTDANIDGITNQIMNNKRVRIIFYLRSNSFYSVDGLEEIKYLESIVLPYASQMIPSNAIFEAEFRYRGQSDNDYVIKVSDHMHNVAENWI